MCTMASAPGLTDCAFKCVAALLLTVVQYPSGRVALKKSGHMQASMTPIAVTCAMETKTIQAGCYYMLALKSG